MNRRHLSRTCPGPAAPGPARGPGGKNLKVGGCADTA